MGFMRRLLPIAAVLALSLPASAQEYLKYSQQRQNTDAIDDAVAVLSNSDIHGTFNRISALLGRGQVRDLPSEGGVIADTPDNFQQGMELALEDLRADLEQANDEYGIDHPQEQYILLQVVDAVVIRRLVELHHFNNIIGCEPVDGSPQTTCPPITGNPPLYTDMEGLVDILRPWVEGVIDHLEDKHDDGFTGPQTGAFMDALAYHVRIDEIREWGRAKGEPSIDY